MPFDMETAKRTRWKLVLKIIFYFTVMVFCHLYRTQHFPLPSDPTMKQMTGNGAILLLLFCAMLLMRSYRKLRELNGTINKEGNKKKDLSECFVDEYEMEEILQFFRESDEMEVQIKWQNRLVFIGVSSDEHAGDLKKSYYIDEKEFVREEDFIQSLAFYGERGKLFVMEIE